MLREAGRGRGRPGSVGDWGDAGCKGGHVLREARGDE